MFHTLALGFAVICLVTKNRHRVIILVGSTVSSLRTGFIIPCVLVKLEPFICRRAGIISAVGTITTCRMKAATSRGLGDSLRLGYILKAERQYEELYNKIKRWSYNGRPTRKARKLQALEARMEACHKIVAKSEGISL